MSTLFFISEGAPAPSRALQPDYSSELWRPRALHLVPRGMSLVPFTIWWGFHHAGIFYNRDFGILTIRYRRHMVHRSCVFPGFFRFPFMAKDDLQVGDTWTDPAHRNRGLAAFALQEILRLSARSGRRFWYLVEEENTPSIRAVEKAGFTCCARGLKHPRLGLRFFGYYWPDQATAGSAAQLSSLGASR
jgi:GNAT superfamily N-acetyltransferase